jgi:hypothetical protein
MRNRNHPALKHGAYSALAVLPGESQAAFEKLHRDQIAELAPSGGLEHDIVLTIARLRWRKQNLGTLRIAELAQGRWSATSQIGVCLPPFPLLYEASEEEKEKAKEAMLVAQDQVRKELGDTYELVELGGVATFDGLTKALDVEERLDAAIARCLKQLLLVRGVKSVAATPAAASPKRALAPPKAA